MDGPTLGERILGGLLGVAAGDALGATLEFMSPSQIRAEHGVHQEITGGGAFGWRPGQGTDDTDLTWAVAQGYLAAGGVDLLDDIARRFLDWRAGDPPDIGNTTASALAELSSTGDPRSSGLTSEDSCGNGSLMRAIPTGLVRVDAALRRSESAAISAITHAHPVCIDSCVAYNDIVASLLGGVAPSEAIGGASAPELAGPVRGALAVDPRTSVEELPTSGYVIDSLRCAAWAVQQSDTAESVLVALVNRGRDADTTGAIAGGLLGVLHGAEAIPARWRTKLEYAERLTAAAQALEQMRDT